MDRHHALRGRRAAAVAIVSFTGLAATAPAQVEPHAGMLKYPDISAEHIVFSYANDLWIVPRDGGTAQPLASPQGEEMFPRFSPDGQSVAFVGNYEGDSDLYVIPVGGGAAQRVTHHPMTEVLSDWTAGNELLFFGSGMGGLARQTQLFTVAPEGGMPEMLPVPYGAVGSISADGKWLAYTPHTRDNRTWKRYRGGMATDIWLFNLETHESRKITDWEGTDTQPMWHDGVVYYLSDEGPEHRLNIWSFNPRTNERRQITTYEDFDIKWPAMGPGPNGRGEIVFQLGSRLYRLDLGNQRATQVRVIIPGDRPRIRQQRVNAAEFITAASISPGGERVAFAGRGDVWTAPAEKGSPRNLTRSSGSFERSVSWSPDGRWIAYFSDEPGEYELFITQSDGKGETKQLTEGNKTFFYSATWSPDSTRIAYTDKAGDLFLVDIDSGESSLIDTDPLAGQLRPSWSHDSRWMAYSKSGDENDSSSIWLYDTESGEKHQVTSGMFNDTAPAFDEKGDWLYFVSSRSFEAIYSDFYGGLESPFVYAGTEVLLAVPLREDVKSPYLAESDEVTWDDDEKKDEDDDAGDDNDDEDDDAENGNDDNDDDNANAIVNGIVGDWSGTISGLKQLGLEDDSLPFLMGIEKEGDTYSGWSEVMGERVDFDSVTFNERTGAFTGATTHDNMQSVLNGTLDGATIKGTWELIGQGFTGEWEATRQDGDANGGETKQADKADRVEIDIEGFEGRAIQLPVERGSIGPVAVNSSGHVIYGRGPGRGVPGERGIFLFDINDDEKKEKSVTTGSTNFELSADGKKMLVARGGSYLIHDAGAGASGKPVVTAGMTVRVDPRAEWEQMYTDAWRMQRDFFYDPTMHGVDWDAVREQYAAMLPDAASREDVSFLIREMISELNVGHAYYREGRGVERGPNENVGLLGADFEIDNGAYRIAKIYGGAPWDSDSRGPLQQPGLDVKEGDYLLAVNGVPLDTDRDPWAAFIGTAGRAVTLTVSDRPEMDDEAREVVVEPVSSEVGLRYRAWVEQNRRMVDELSGGRVGYIYVPNTGVQGQTELIRQFYGQTHKDALIIDERWNGGGQVPSRFIELLNRPVSNYWARRDGRDWRSPFRSHQGPKAMLINGLAGSGGDAFPWLFRRANLGPIIGTRTWGGLVGIGGYPPLVDGASITAPSFAFYETDGTWGVEGHGVDPDIEVVDDPALMVDGGDPQIEKAVEVLLKAVEESGYQSPQRPGYPDRRRMGIPEEDW